MRTVTRASGPRVGSRSCGGVTRDASGTASVSSATPSPARPPSIASAGDVPRRDDEREAERDLIAVDRERHRQLQRDGRVLAGGEVADADGEYLRPVLLGERGAFPRRARRSTRRAPPAFLELCLDAPAAEDGDTRVHRGAVGQGKHVDSLDGLRVGVVERLHHAHGREEADDVGVDVDRGEREPAEVGSQLAERRRRAVGGLVLQQTDGGEVVVSRHRSLLLRVGRRRWPRRALRARRRRAGVTSSRMGHVPEPMARLATDPPRIDRDPGRGLGACAAAARRSRPGGLPARRAHGRRARRGAAAPPRGSLRRPGDA